MIVLIPVTVNTNETYIQPNSSKIEKVTSFSSYYF